MIDQWKQLGVFGPFLDTLLLLYGKVRQQVCVYWGRGGAIV